MELVNAADAGLIEKVRELYLSAFPKEEQKPFSLLEDKSKDGSVEILAIKNNDGQFAGLAITACHKDLAMLDYFAVAPHHRQGGIGSRALQALKEKYAGRRFLLEIESTRVRAENHEQRQRRKAFYLKNGMTEAPFAVNLCGVEMEIMISGQDVTFNDYIGLYRQVFGDQFCRQISPAAAKA